MWSMAFVSVVFDKRFSFIRVRIEPLESLVVEKVFRLNR